MTLAATSAVVFSLLAALIAFSMYSLTAREVAETRSDLAERRLLVQQGISDALAEVARLRESRSVAARGDGVIVNAAREQLQRAVGLAEGGPIDPQLMAQVRALEQELNNEQAVLAQERRDRDFLKTLESAWLLQANVDVRESRFSNEESVSVLRKALQDYGIRMLDSRPADVAAMVTSRRPEVQQHLLAAMEELRGLARPIIGVQWRTVDGKIITVGIVPDSPAARDGRLREGDELVGVGEGLEGEIVSTRSLAMPSVADLLRGESGTIVRLEVIPKGRTESSIFEIQRDPTAAWLKEVVKTADSDPWRCRLREAYMLEDPGTRRETLTQLAEQVDVQRQPVRVLTRLADHLDALGDESGVLSARLAPRHCYGGYSRRTQVICGPTRIWPAPCVIAGRRSWKRRYATTRRRSRYVRTALVCT